MTVARSVADVLDDHVVFEVECIDRICLNVYVRGLQYPAGLVAFVHRQLDLPIASTVPLGKISDGFGDGMRRFARDQRVPWVDFAKGQRKDDVMHQHLASFTAEEGVLFIGRAQEKNSVFRTEKRRNAEGRAYPWIVRSTGVVNHYYVYAVDADFGPFFLKFCSYFPYTARLCLNGHEWANVRPPRPGSATPRWTTASPPARTRPRCRRSVTSLGPRRSRRYWTSGWRSCCTRSPTPTGTRATDTSSRSSLTQMFLRVGVDDIIAAAGRGAPCPDHHCHCGRACCSSNSAARTSSARPSRCHTAPEVPGSSVGKIRPSSWVRWRMAMQRSSPSMATASVQTGPMRTVTIATGRPWRSRIS